MFNTLKKSLLKPVLAAALVATMGTGIAYASGGGQERLEHVKWSFNGMFGTYDKAAAQRGYQVYREVCASCHALEHLSFRHLGDKGAPFYDANFKNPNDNPTVKAFAKDWDVPSIDQDSGDITTRPGIPADKFPAIYDNPIAAAASNGGAVPPDLSIITMARTGGADYVYSLLTGYHDEAPHDFHLSDGMNYNDAFPDFQIAMVQPLFDGAVEYAPVNITDEHGKVIETIAAPVATVDQMARDVTQFLAWSGDPKMEVRKKIGFATFLFLFIFSLLLFMTYKEVWKNVKH